MSFRRFGCLGLLALVALFFAAPGAKVSEAATSTVQSGPPEIGMAAGILVDVTTGRILWAKDAQVQRPPASLTKILTALVVLERATLTDSAPITPEARNAPGSRTYAEAGWVFTIRDHLWGLLLQSGNDSAVALAQKLSPDGTIEGFMKIANETAASLGATSTTFFNPHGMDHPGHVTTARDIALITMKAMQNPVFAEMVASKTHNVPWGDGNPHTYFNHNKLLWRYQGTIGVKTGFTEGAGHSLVSAVNRDGNTLVAVVMGSPDHYAESIALYDWGFANLTMLRGLKGQTIQPKAAPAPKAAAPAPARTNGLEVVQVEEEAVAVKSQSRQPIHSAPLIGPLVALAVSALITSMISKSRQKRRENQGASGDRLMGELRRHLEPSYAGGVPIEDRRREVRPDLTVPIDAERTL